MASRFHSLLVTSTMLTAGAMSWAAALPSTFAQGLAPVVSASFETGSLRPVALEDYYALRSVGAPKVSPDGRTVIYVVTTHDRKNDQTVSSLWRVQVEGGDPQPLTHGSWGVSSLDFSPDGRFISFISSRDAMAWGISPEVGEKGQVYVMPLAGGEAFPITEFDGGVRSYRWAPDAAHLAVVSMRPKVSTSTPAGTVAPIIVTRLKHKYDGLGYLDDRRAQVHLIPVTGALESSGRTRASGRQLTDDAYEHSSPNFSPDGRWVAFQSNRTPEPDSNFNTDIFKVEVASGHTERVTDHPGGDSSPVFSPDGRWIAYVSQDPEWSMYPTPRVMAVPASGGEARNLTGHLDRWVTGALVWAPDSRSIYIRIADEGRRPLLAVNLEARVARVLEGNVGGFAVTDKQLVLSLTKPDRPSEVYVAELNGDFGGKGGSVSTGTLRDLSKANSTTIESLDIQPTESIWFDSSDGTPVHAWAVKPPGFDPARQYPMILWIHGGPVGQFTDAFDFTRQYLASLGYVVLLVNPRGSNGYGEEFSRAIFADWGGADYEDVMAGVNHLIAAGYVDPERLGVGGYSYGGILTNYVIVKTDRFKGAISGASDADYYSAFGTDDWGIYWIHEFGAPWDNIDLYRDVSPITYIKNAVTPTLFVHGQYDWRDPLTQSEQMYLSLRVLGVETALIVYPGQSHGISVPSYRFDLLRRYGLWFDKYVQGKNVDPLYDDFNGSEP